MVPYLPSLYTVLLGITIVAFVFLSRLPILLLGVITVFIFLIVFYQHIDTFSYEYKQMGWSDAAAAVGPYLLVASVVILALGYILSIRTGQRGARVVVPTTTVGTTTPSTARVRNEGSANSTQFTAAAPPRPNSNSERREFLSALNRAI